ncbi:CoA-binding protein [Desulfonatronospira sp.]|uniref:CoA-binding protein n=1 Tax=Desulfonatronospira sp. TaxID=1962951 RepID=UPI0025C207F1|nr:CoA-binding protein [Desulfonatronospira sp.]
MDIHRDQDIKNLLQQAATIAVVGAKDKPGQPVDTVGRYLIQAGYRVIPVHPKRKSVWGLDTYADLTRIPEPVDIVDLFRASNYCPDHALEVLEMKHVPRAFWMQLGITSAQAAEILQEKPIQVVQDKCILVEHKRLLGV